MGKIRHFLSRIKSLNFDISKNKSPSLYMSLITATLLLLLYGNLPPFLLRWWGKKSYPKLAKVLLFYMLAFTTIQIGIALDEIGGFKKERHYQQVKKQITSKDTDVERRMVSLLLATEGMKNDFDNNTHQDEIPTLVRQIQAEAIRLLSNHNLLQDTLMWKDNALFISQLSMILSDVQHITKDTNHHFLNTQIVKYLQREMLLSPNFQLKSYASFQGKWLCDNAGFMYAMDLYDKENKTDLHTAVWEKWKNNMYAHLMDAKSELPCSQTSDSIACFEVARASSSAWLLAYLSLLKTEEGQLFWRNYQRNFKFSLIGIGAAYKEFSDGWTPSSSFAYILDPNCDYDSGPIVFGLGTYASGLSIYTAACNQDALTYMQLKNAFWVVSWLQAYLTDEDVLITTLLYNAESRWGKE